MKYLSQASLLGLSVALAACTTVGPDYKLPTQASINRPAARGGFDQVDGQHVSAQPVVSQWWTLYHDPVLNQMVDAALKANTNLRVASANLQKAMAVSEQVDAESGIHAAVSAEAQRARFSGESYLLSEEMPVYNVGGYGVNVSYQLDLFGQLKRGEEAAHASTESVEAARDLARLTVVADTVRAYMQVCSANHGYQVMQQQYHLQNKQVDLMQRLYKAGRGQSMDVLRAQSQADTLKASLPIYQAARDTALYRLAMLLGKAPGEPLPQPVTCQTEPSLSQPIPVGDGRELLQRRPDVKQSERGLAQSTAMVGVATAELYPSITLGASAGYSGMLKDLGRGETQEFGIGPLIHWSIPDSGSRARVTAAKAETAAALARFDGVVLNALREVQTSLSVYGKDLQHLAMLREARDKARLVADQNRRLYQAGRAPYLSSLDAHRTLVSNDVAVATAESKVVQDQVNLFLALGGGWEQPKAGK